MTEIIEPLKNFRNKTKGKKVSASPRGETPLNSSSSSTSIPFGIQGLEVKGDKGFFEEECLSVGIKRVFNIDLKDKTTINEIQVVVKNQALLNLIENQKVFHVRGMIREFEVSQKRLYALKAILVRRKLLIPAKWIGKARATFGMLLYLTRDCTREHLETYLLDYEELDELLYETQLNRDKKKSPKDVVDHNKQVSELSRKIKAQQPLTKQEKAKAVLAADDIKIHASQLDDELNSLRAHVKHCSSCERATLLGQENTCGEYHKIRQRHRRLSKKVVETIAKVPDKISSAAVNQELIETFTKDVTGQIPTSSNKLISKPSKLLEERMAIERSQDTTSMISPGDIPIIDEKIPMGSPTIKLNEKGEQI